MDLNEGARLYAMGVKASKATKEFTWHKAGSRQWLNPVMVGGVPLQVPASDCEPYLHEPIEGLEHGLIGEEIEVWMKLSANAHKQKYKCVVLDARPHPWDIGATNPILEFLLWVDSGRCKGLCVMPLADGLQESAGGKISYHTASGKWLGLVPWIPVQDFSDGGIDFFDCDRLMTKQRRWHVMYKDLMDRTLASKVTCSEVDGEYDKLWPPDIDVWENGIGFGPVELRYNEATELGSKEFLDTFFCEDVEEMPGLDADNTAMMLCEFLAKPRDDILAEWYNDLENVCRATGVLTAALVAHGRDDVYMHSRAYTQTVPSLYVDQGQDFEVADLMLYAGWQSPEMLAGHVPARYFDHFPNQRLFVQSTLGVQWYLPFTNPLTSHTYTETRINELWDQLVDALAAGPGDLANRPEGQVLLDLPNIIRAQHMMYVFDTAMHKGRWRTLHTYGDNCEMMQWLLGVTEPVRCNVNEIGRSAGEERLVFKTEELYPIKEVLGGDGLRQKQKMTMFANVWCYNQLIDRAMDQLYEFKRRSQLYPASTMAQLKVATVFFMFSGMGPLHLLRDAAEKLKMHKQWAFVVICVEKEPHLRELMCRYAKRVQGRFPKGLLCLTYHDCVPSVSGNLDLANCFCSDSLLASTTLASQTQKALQAVQAKKTETIGQCHKPRRPKTTDKHTLKTPPGKRPVARVPKSCTRRPLLQEAGHKVTQRATHGKAAHRAPLYTLVNEFQCDRLLELAKAVKAVSNPAKQSKLPCVLSKAWWSDSNDFREALHAVGVPACLWTLWMSPPCTNVSGNNRVLRDANGGETALKSHAFDFYTLFAQLMAGHAKPEVPSKPPTEQPRSKRRKLK